PLRDRFFFDTSNQCNPKPFKRHSAQNRKILKEIAKLEGLQNSIAKQIRFLYETRLDRQNLFLETRLNQ
ncbi:MAG: hypothetical protein SVX43_15015, partial [Cyanobacteriota bacterium]|nr:hypothetical protein [Cyanobacteriota bacterium]